MLRSLISKIFPSFKKRIRLRHILHLGSVMEKQAEAFYRQFAKEAQDEDVRKLCLELANEERKHFGFIQDILSRWKSLPVNKGDLKAMDADGRLRRLFLSPPNPDRTKKEFIKYAMNEEKKMVNFYMNFEKEFAHEWRKMKLWSMVKEEMEHVKKLESMLSKN
ncbi:MAG: ferritin family protein [Syntrophobacterales bacterium]